MKKRIIVFLLAVSMLGCTACSNKAKDNVNSMISSDMGMISSMEDRLESDFQTSSTEESSSQTSSEASSDNKTTNVMAQNINGEKIDVTKEASLETKKRGWGQGKQVDSENRPVSCDSYQSKYGEYGGIFIMPKTEKKIYLTFDEGYEYQNNTAKILDTLKEKNCKAVFFVTLSYVKKNPELVKRMIDEGHTVGNHSVNHLSMPTLSIQKQIEEIAGLHNYMVEKYNYQMTLFRPPMGEWSVQSLAVAQKLSYKSVFWSYAYVDFYTDKQMGVDKALPLVVNAAHNGAVYLLHAVSTDNATMLGDVIDQLRGKGYSLELLK